MTLSTDGFAPLLTALAAGSQQYFGDTHAILEPVARLDRPFSNLLRLRVTAGGREWHAFLKVFKPQRFTPEELAKLRSYAECEFSATKSLYDAIDTRSGLTALRPVALFVEDMAIVTEEVAGTGFDRVLRDALWGRQTVAPIDVVAERIGAWVRTYQRVIEVEGELSLDERREYLDLRLRKLMDAEVLTATQRAMVLEYFDQIAAEIGSRPLHLVAIHADLCPTNILVGPDGGVTVLDFAMAKSGTRFHDLAHLYMHLKFMRWHPRLKPAIVNAAQEALLRGYDPAVSADDPMFRLMLLQHLVCHVAFLRERQTGALEPAYRWFLRRHWARCARVLGLPSRRVAVA
jgi:hypothetical protein